MVKTSTKKQREENMVQNDGPHPYENEGMTEGGALVVSGTKTKNIYVCHLCV